MRRRNSAGAAYEEGAQAKQGIFRVTMTLDEIQRASAEHFRMAQMDTAEVSETTPLEITSQVEAFAASLSGTAVFVPVASDAHGLYGFCNDGVKEKIKADGGDIVFGWSIWEWPSVMLTAEFHAVWHSEAGELLDITPKPHGEHRILFVPDYTYPADFNFDKRPLNRRIRIHEAPDREKELAAMRAKLAGGQLKYEEKRAAKEGVSLEEWLRTKLPPDTLGETIDELIEVCDAFDAHFDSLGVAGNVIPDDKFKALGLRRLRVQERMKSLLKPRNG